MSIFGTIGKLAKGAIKIGAPIAGMALGGPLGAQIGTAISGGISGAEAEGRAGKLNKQALDLALSRNRELAPLRSKALGLAQNLMPGREDLSSIFADPGNPYARAIPRPAAPPPLTQAGLPPFLRGAPQGQPVPQPGGIFGGGRNVGDILRRMRQPQGAAY